MIEFIKHVFGFCGEGHLTIFHMLGPLLIPFIYFRNMIKIKFNQIKNKILNNES